MLPEILQKTYYDQAFLGFLFENSLYGHLVGLGLREWYRRKGKG